MDSREVSAIILKQLMSFKPIMIGLFGSYTRDEMNPESDIDILVKFSQSPSLLQIIGIENQLSELIGRKIDLITEGSLKNSRIKSSISKDLKIIYQA